MPILPAPAGGVAVGVWAMPAENAAKQTKSEKIIFIVNYGS